MTIFAGDLITYNHISLSIILLEYMRIMCQNYKKRLFGQGNNGVSKPVVFWK